MGLIIEINDHLDVELRRESFIVHDDELHPSQEAPEFHYKRVYPMIAMLQRVETSERFQRWLAKAEQRHYLPPRDRVTEEVVRMAVRLGITDGRNPLTGPQVLLLLKEIEGLVG